MIKQLLAIATQCPHGFGRLIFVEEHLYWGGLNRALGSLTLRRRRSTHQCRLYTNIQTAKIEHNSTFRSRPIYRPVPVKIKWPNLLDTRWGDFKIGEIAGLDRSARWVVLERMQKGSRRSMLRKHANIPLEWNTSLNDMQQMSARFSVKGKGLCRGAFRNPWLVRVADAEYTSVDMIPSWQMIIDQGRAY